ncbi:MAG: outer membrane lipoprotein chaperone LolA [Proteobacteria bacterium]|nr:outer membrane lipoprotein chaperone LolA [Pseudomonadota bacterium]
MRTETVTFYRRTAGKILAVLGTTLLISLSSISFAEKSDIYLVERSLKATTAFSGRFALEYFDSLQDKKTYSEGIFAFKQPGLMRWTYQKPEEFKIIVGKDTIWIYDPILENVTVQKIDKVPGINSLAFLYEPERLSKHFKEISPSQKLLDKEPGDRWLFLIPKKKNQNISELQIAFDTNANQIRQFVIIDGNRNYRKITFSKMKSNPELDPSEFEFNIPEGMEVIDGTQ